MHIAFRHFRLYFRRVDGHLFDRFQAQVRNHSHTFKLKATKEKKKPTRLPVPIKKETTVVKMGNTYELIPKSPPKRIERKLNKSTLALKKTKYDQRLHLSQTSLHSCHTTSNPWINQTPQTRNCIIYWPCSL